MAIGQAAGTAAALAATTGTRPRDLDVPTLQKTLEADGASLRRDPQAVVAERKLAEDAINSALAEGRISAKYLADAGSFTGRAPRL